VRLSARQLNRTLLHRQHLLERVQLAPEDVADHLVGLQGQETSAPYLSLHARIDGFDPYTVSRGLEEATWVRLGTLRGTLHVHTAADALTVRPWLQESLERQMEGRVPVGLDQLTEATHEVLADGPVEQRELTERLSARFSGAPGDLWVAARVVVPLVQLAPRGTWGGSGPVVLDLLERHVGGTMRAPSTEDVVRRYLRAYGPATAADLAVWSGVTRLRPLLTRMDDLVRHEDPDGKELFDVPDGELADADEPAPVRLLGQYDDVWLAHAARDRVTGPGTRGTWMGGTGAVMHTVFVDGWLTGVWHPVDGRVTVTELFRDLSPAEHSELDEEIARVEAMMAS
jgi:hypothetical protein